MCSLKAAEAELFREYETDAQKMGDDPEAVSELWREYEDRLRFLRKEDNHV